MTKESKGYQETNKVFVVRIPITKGFAQFCIWTLFEVLLSIGIWFQISEFPRFSVYSMFFLIVSGVILFFSTLYYLLDYGILEWLLDHTPKVRFEFR